MGTSRAGRNACCRGPDRPSTPPLARVRADSYLRCIQQLSSQPTGPRRLLLGQVTTSAVSFSGIWDWCWTAKGFAGAGGSRVERHRDVQDAGRLRQSASCLTRPWSALGRAYLRMSRGGERICFRTGKEWANRAQRPGIAPAGPLARRRPVALSALEFHSHPPQGDERSGTPSHPEARREGGADRRRMCALPRSTPPEGPFTDRADADSLCVHLFLPVRSRLRPSGPLFRTAGDRVYLPSPPLPSYLDHLAHVGARSSAAGDVTPHRIPFRSEQ